MPLVLIAPAATLLLAGVTVAGLATLVGRATSELRDELAALAQVRAARDHLVGDLERTRRQLDRPAEVRPAGRGR